MKIQSVKSFRSWYKTNVKYISESDKHYNEDFIGTYHGEKENAVKGFFEMFHGHKPDIKDHLPSILKIAEDGQAIFEFIQNAVDCDSSHFFLFYNDRYFIAVNNGRPFDQEGLVSILNIAQTTKHSPDKIGRFGIGFKLVHRLVGKNEGTEELVNQYKGPILYSWSNKEHFTGLLEKEITEHVSSAEYGIKPTDIPFLTKILLTNFPAQLGEEIKDINYNNRVPFDKNELQELISFTKECFSNHSDKINIDSLSQGSLFFIKLGEGKRDLLDRNYEDLKAGVQYSMNTLKKLEYVFLNDAFVEKQQLSMETYEIPMSSGTFINISPEYKDANIKIAFGYNEDYKNGNRINQSPNFYKYFPMGDENNGFEFIVHCDSFSNESNRRKLQTDDVNKKLLPEIAKFIIESLDGYKQNNRTKFKQMYTSLLLSDIPDKGNNEWLNPIFFDCLLSYIRNTIPVKNGLYETASNNVKIKSVNIPINLSDVGLSHIHWFEWDKDEDPIIIKEAKNHKKLSLESWNICNIIEKGELSKLNQWIRCLDQSMYTQLLSELNLNISRDETKSRLCSLNLFKFSDGNYYPLSELANNFIVNTDKTIGINEELKCLGFVTTELNIDNYKALREAAVSYLPKDKVLFERIKDACVNNKLTPVQKRKLFSSFINDKTKFDGVGDGSLGELSLFCNRKGEILPLTKLVDNSLSTPDWLDCYKIDSSESFDSLKKFLIAEDDLYSKIIKENWESIHPNIFDIASFYSRVKGYYDMKEDNITLENVPFVYVDDVVRFVSEEQVFYNAKFRLKDYTDLQSAISSLSSVHTPEKSILSYLSEKPFKIENSKLIEVCGSIDDAKLELNEVKAVLDFCNHNNESFFEEYVIEENNVNSTYILSNRQEGIYQVWPASKELRQFIIQNSTERLKVLPAILNEYKEEKAIISGQNLDELILRFVDVYEHRISLIDLIRYNADAMRSFIKALPQIQFISGTEYRENDYDCKILKRISELFKTDYSLFRDRMRLKTDLGNLRLADISFSGDICLDGKSLSLSNILTKTYVNGIYLEKLIDALCAAGFSRSSMNEMFAVSDTPEPEDIFAKFKEQISILENETQFAFIMLYNKVYDGVDMSNFSIPTMNGLESCLSNSFYKTNLSFINQEHIMTEEYANIDKFLSLPFKSDDNYILEKPYFEKQDAVATFVCPGINETLTDNEKLEFVEFLFAEWSNGNKDAIKKIDWSKIDKLNTISVLSFNPRNSVYPSKYALGKEALPDYLQVWIAMDREKIAFLADLGVWTEDTVLVDLRKSFLEKSSFVSTRIAQEGRFSKYDVLFSTLIWLKENAVKLENNNEYSLFKELVRVNNSYEYCTQIVVNDTFNFENLAATSKEWSDELYMNWKKSSGLSIYLYDGDLPKFVSVDKISDYVFREYQQGIVVLNDSNIYVNQNDLKKALQSVVNEDVRFGFEDLWILFQSHAANDAIVLNQDQKEIFDLVEELTPIQKEELKRMLRTKNFMVIMQVGSQALSNDGSLFNSGEKGENIVYEDLVKKFGAKRVKWTSSKNPDVGDYNGTKEYDFIVYDITGQYIQYYIDAKSTTELKFQTDKTTIYWRNSEWEFIETNYSNKYLVARVFGVNSDNPEIIYLEVKRTELREM